MLIFLAVIATPDMSVGRLVCPLVCQSVGQSYNTILKIQMYIALDMMHGIQCIEYSEKIMIYRIWYIKYDA